MAAADLAADDDDDDESGNGGGHYKGNYKGGAQTIIQSRVCA